MAAKIEGLITFGDECVIHVGVNSEAVTFVRAGPALWLADCLTPGCRGLIESDSSVFAPVMCLECERRLDEEAELDALQRPPAVKAHSHQPTTASLPTAIPTAPLPMPKAHFGHQQCRKCGRFTLPDNSSGIIPSVCGTCQSEKAESKPEHRCRECNESLEGSHSSRLYCDSCVRARAATGQRRMTKTSKTTRERRANRLCARCKTVPLGADAHSAVKYCPECRDAAYREASRKQMQKYKSKKQGASAND